MSVNLAIPFFSGSKIKTIKIEVPIAKIVLIATLNSNACGINKVRPTTVAEIRSTTIEYVIVRNINNLISSNRCLIIEYAIPPIKITVAKGPK
ncbi:MAG: hypothetical protein WC544_04270 [Patescibacteria group bacterium]